MHDCSMDLSIMSSVLQKASKGENVVGEGPARRVVNLLSLETKNGVLRITAIVLQLRLTTA